MRPVSGDAEGLTQEILDRSFSIEENISFRRDYLLQVLDKLYFLIIEIIPVSAGVIPRVGIIVTLIHRSRVIAYRK